MHTGAGPISVATRSPVHRRPVVPCPGCGTSTPAPPSKSYDSVVRCDPPDARRSSVVPPSGRAASRSVATCAADAPSGVGSSTTEPPRRSVTPVVSSDPSRTTTCQVRPPPDSVAVSSLVGVIGEVAVIVSPRAAV